MKRVNRGGRGGHRKTGSRGGAMRAKPKQEAFNNQDQYQELFPQLGASPSKTNKTTKQSQPVRQQQAKPEQVSKNIEDVRSSK